MSISGNAPPMRGVFWVVDEKLLAFPFCPDHPLVPFYPEGIAKPGVTYNHEKLWNTLGWQKNEAIQLLSARKSGDFLSRSVHSLHESAYFRRLFAGNQKGIQPLRRTGRPS